VPFAVFFLYLIVKFHLEESTDKAWNMYLTIRRLVAQANHKSRRY
jgi:hypothetical protein